MSDRVIWRSMPSVIGCTVGWVACIAIFTAIALRPWQAAIGHVMFAALAVGSCYGAVQAARSGIVFDGMGVTVHSMLRTRHAAWPEVVGVRTAPWSPVNHTLYVGIALRDERLLVTSAFTTKNSDRYMVGRWSADVEDFRRRFQPHQLQQTDAASPRT